MKNNPKFDYYDGAGNVHPADSLPELKPGKVKSTIELLNKAGVLMKGNGSLQIGLGTYRVVVRQKECLQIVDALPYRTVNATTYETVNVRELIDTAMNSLKEWIGEEYISKKILGQTVLMTLIYPDFDKGVFIHVLKHKLNLEEFLDIIEIGGGEFDEELVIAGALPEYLREALKELA